MKNYQLYNLFLIPLILILIFGVLSSPIPFTFEFEYFAKILGLGIGPLLIGYYPIKLIMLFVNKYRKNRWEWPIGYSYFILPLIILCLTTFFQ